MVQLSYQFKDPTTGENVSDLIILDASVHESHGVSAEVTSHQVETGSDITDHIRPKPRKVTVEGLVTNTPLATPPSQARGVIGSQRTASFTVNGQQVSYQALQFSGEFDRVRDVYGGLVAAALAGALFQVVTSLATYDDVAITNFEVPRDVSSGGSVSGTTTRLNAMRFTIDFQQLRFATTEVVAALPSQKLAVKHQGAKPTTAVDDASKKKSLLSSIVTSLSGAFK